MTDTLTETPAHTPAPLAVHFTDSATATAQTLDDRLRRTLNKAVQVLADNPFPPQSAPLADDMLQRRVRASQSLVVDYRTSEQHLLVEAVTQVAKDDPTGLPTTQAEQPATDNQAQPAAAPQEQGTDPQPQAGVQWEKVTVAPFRDLAAPPVACHEGAAQATSHAD